MDNKQSKHAYLQQLDSSERRHLGNQGGTAIKERRNKPTAVNTAEIVRSRIESGGERIWRLSDFERMPVMAVAQTLSRLTRQGLIQRVAKGLYYRPRQTAMGPSRPDMAEVRSLAVGEKGIFPAGVGAANLLGFTTRRPTQVEVATNGLSLPRLIFGEAIVHTRRPASWLALSQTDAALLDFLRNRGTSSELPPEKTVEKLLGYFSEEGRLERLLKVAPMEPPRVRAMLGAIAQQLGQPNSRLSRLRKTLNSLSKFDFGVLVALKYAREWQAK
jgi:Family of unknown function (DUF6088)